MISVLHRSVVSTKAEWRANTSCRSLPPIPDPIPWPAPIPLPQTVHGLRISNDARLYTNRQIGQLKPWHPVRLLRNERRAYNNGQWYTVEDYYLLLQIGPRPAELPPLRLIDHQHDLA